jgi:hypothetical protein
MAGVLEKTAIDIIIKRVRQWCDINNTASLVKFFVN